MPFCRKRMSRFWRLCCFGSGFCFPFLSLPHLPVRKSLRVYSPILRFCAGRAPYPVHSQPRVSSCASPATEQTPFAGRVQQMQWTDKSCVVFGENRERPVSRSTVFSTLQTPRSSTDRTYQRTVVPMAQQFVLPFSAIAAILAYILFLGVMSNWLG